MQLAIVDSHCHLDFPQLADDLDRVIERAGAAGVRLMVTISTRVKQIERVLAIAETHEGVYCTVGTHPHNAKDEPEVTVEDLVRLAQHPSVVGIGEAGLDYHYDNSPRDSQAESFRIHIRASQETGLPLVIHSRDAEVDTASILEEEADWGGAFKPLLHCFSSHHVLAERALPLGAYVSFSGILTFNGSEALRDSARKVPLDRLLVETDAPYLAPTPHRGKPNEPAYTALTLERLAELRGISKNDMASVTSDNFFRLFDKAVRPPNFEAAA